MNASFIHKYWGDLVAVHLIYLGIVIIFIAEFYAHSNSDISHVGESLIVLGAGTLRFRSMKEDKQGDRNVIA
jgi:hypothetical protein